MNPDDVYEATARRLGDGGGEWVPARDVLDVQREGAAPGELDPWIGWS